MSLSDLFHKKSTETGAPAASTPAAAPGQLSGDSTVGEWLAHPIGGAMFREMLAQAGQKEGVLRPVHRLALKKLVAMSGGRFTEELMNDMIAKANSGQMPADTPAATSATPTEAPKPAEAPRAEWVEQITTGRFAGQTVIVTGAGSGIGRATASRVAREGGRVIAVDMSKERLDEFAGTMVDQQVVTVVGDITSEDDIAQIMKTADGQVDALANVAGIMDNMTPLHEVDDKTWDRVLAVNLTGMMKLSRAVLPLMLVKHAGAIVNVGSEASLRGSAAGAAYTASKHAVIGLTKSSAFMYGPSGIRINAVAPGAVMTNIQASFDSRLGEERVNASLALMPDAATSEELAATITFLLSRDSVNVNGAIVASDGGWSAV